MERDHDTIAEFRVCFPDPPAENRNEVRATVDRPARTITYQLPGGARTTVDVVTARALCMLLHEAIFGALHPHGPKLRVERLGAAGWHTDGTPAPQG